MDVHFGSGMSVTVGREGRSRVGGSVRVEVCGILWVFVGKTVNVFFEGSRV